MRVLHVWDHCGVSALIAKELNRRGHYAVVLKRWDSSDRYSLGQDTFYDIILVGEKDVTPSYSFVPKSLRRLGRELWHIKRKLWHIKKVLKFYVTVMCFADYFDLVHVHSLICLFFLVPKRKLILHFHGDDIRQRPSLKGFVDRLFSRLFLRLFSSRYTFYLSTPDLLRDCPSGVYMPNPVDVEHFSVNPRNFDVGTALYTENWHEKSCAWAKDMAERHGLLLTNVNRAKNDYIPYQNFPEYLANFEFFIDRHGIESLSKTALEALALGLKVIRWDGKIVEGLPEEHLPENVADRWMEIYKEKLKT